MTDVQSACSVVGLVEQFALIRSSRAVRVINFTKLHHEGGGIAGNGVSRFMNHKPCRNWIMKLFCTIGHGLGAIGCRHPLIKRSLV